MNNFDLAGTRKETNAYLNSPYLNFDPSILRQLLQTQKSDSSKFIIPEGQGEHRGKMEMSFLKIGGAVCAGGAFGGLNGLYLGLKDTKNVALPIKKTMLLNYIAKHGSKSSQAFGSIALIYSLYDTFVSNARGVDDEFNVIPAGALTGLTYSMTSGLRSMAKGSLFGLAAALTYLGLAKRDDLINSISINTKNEHRY